MGLRRDVFCYRITAWWSLAGTSGDWLVQHPSSKQGQEKQHCQCSPQPLWAACSFFSHCHSKKKKGKIRCLNGISCAQFVPFASFSSHHWKDSGSGSSSPMKCLQALIRSPLLYSPSSLILCSHVTNAPRCGPPSMPTALLYWEAQHARCACTPPAQDALGFLCCKDTAGSWSMHPPGPLALF